MKLNDDKNTASVQIDAQLDAKELDALIRKLALLRAAMTPSVSSHRSTEVLEAGTLVEEAQNSTISLRREGGFRLWLRHRGLGWLGWNMDERTARSMADFITARTSQVQGLDFIVKDGGTGH